MGWKFWGGIAVVIAVIIGVMGFLGWAVSSDFDGVKPSEWVIQESIFYGACVIAAAIFLSK